jgi:uncharacterized protein YqeY
MSDSAPLREAVAARMKESMKGGDKVRVGALRLIMSALKDREIEARGAGKIVSRADELALLTKMVKSRQESAAIYAEAIASTGATGIKDMGKVVNALKAAHAGEMDFAKASAIVKGLLAG